MIDEQLTTKKVTPHTALSVIRAIAPDVKPKAAVILGSGLGNFADQLTNKISIPYADIPGFKTCSVVGHKGLLHLGTINGIELACLQGRPHYYEGASDETFHTLVRSLKLLGVETIIITNAAGSLREEVGPGEVVMINDHINFHQRNPLIGANDDEFGERFISVEDLYNEPLRQRFHNIATDQDIKLHEGVLISVLGPIFETPAEIRAFRILGADVVGMSSVPEAIVAHHCGIKVAMISAITNYAAGMRPEKLSHEVTLRGATLATDKLFALLSGYILITNHF